MSERKINIMTTKYDVMKITIKDGLIEDHIGLSYADLKARFIESKFYAAHRANMGTPEDLVSSFMEHTIRGEADIYDLKDFIFWLRNQI